MNDKSRSTVTIRKIHFAIDIGDEWSIIACMYTWLENQGNVSSPNWKATAIKEKVTCKRCLGMMKTDFRSLD